MKIKYESPEILIEWISDENLLTASDNFISFDDLEVYR